MPTSRSCARRICAAVAAGLLCACASHDDSRGPNAGAIVFNLSEDPHGLNPALARNDDERQVSHLMFDMLLDVDAKGRLVPALAESVPTRENGGVSADGRTITYRLRRGLRWQDGAPLTSRDIAFSWRYVVDRRNAVQTTTGYDLIASVDTPDSRTAIVRLRRAWAPAVGTLFTYGVAPMPVLPEHLLGGAGDPKRRIGDFALHPIGSGPYRLVRWDRGERLIFERDPRYWRGAARWPSLIARIVPDVNTDLTLLRTGELDWSLLSPAQRLAIAGKRGIAFSFAPFAGFGGIAFDCRHAPFDDVRMRRAIAMAIDRDRLSAGITRGQYKPIDSDLPPFSWAYDPAVRLPRYDPAAADSALDALGWRRGADGVRRKNGVRLEMTFTTFPEGDTAVRTAEYVQRMLAARGVDVPIKRISLTQFYLPASEGGLLLGGKFDFAYAVWRSGVDPDDSELVTCRGSSNYAGYCSPAVDALETRALASPYRAFRRAAYRAVQRALARDVPYLYLYAPTYGFAVREGLRGFEPTPYSPTWNSYAWERVK